MLNSKMLCPSAILFIALLAQPVFSQTIVTPRDKNVFQDGVVLEQPFDKVIVEADSNGKVTFIISAGKNKFIPFDSSKGLKSPSPTFDRLNYIDVGLEEMGNDNFATLDENVSKDEKTIKIFFTIKDAKFFGVGKPLHFEGNMVILGGNGGAGESIDHHWAIEISLNEIDLDIDSTDNYEDYFTTSFRTPEIDADEDIATGGKWKGKTIFVNDIDKDGDHVPDYADGWDCSYIQVGLLPGEKWFSNHRNVNLKDKFVPLIMELKPQSSIKTDQIRVKFDYPLSRLEDMKMVTKKWDVKMDIQVKNPDPKSTKPYYKEDTRNVEATLVKADKKGKIRVWKKDGNVKRNKDDIIDPNKTYNLKDLQMEMGKPFTFYIEGINASDNWRDIRIVASLSLDGGKTWKAEDAVRCTCIRSNFTVAVVRQYKMDANSGWKSVYEPNYASPEATLSILYPAYRDTKEYLAKRELSNHYPDPWWHEQDATLGHGFCFYQYEGPTDAILSNSDEDYKKYDNTCYYGKTGSSSGFWEHGRATRNEQDDLTWWHYCSYTIWGRPLVVKQSYTLTPLLMSRMVKLLNNDKRYTSPAKEPITIPREYVLDNTAFGLDIEYSESKHKYRYGCLSNVGLVLSYNAEQQEISSGEYFYNIQLPGFNNYLIKKECKWVFADKMPSTANRSIWDVIFAVAGAAEDPRLTKQQKLQWIDRLNQIVGIIIKHNHDIKWAEYVHGSDDDHDPNSLVSELYQLLKGQVVPAINGLQPIDNVVQLGINDVPTHLNFFDPGLVPMDISDNPSDIFYIRKENDKND